MNTRNRIISIRNTNNTYSSYPNLYTLEIKIIVCLAH